MTSNRFISYLLLTLSALVITAPEGRAQGAPSKDEQTLVKNCVKSLVRFASKAKSKKVGPRAKQAFDLVLEYDPDNKRARSELGFRKVKGQWVGLPKEKRKKWRDKATYEGRFKILEEWAKTAVALSTQHAKLGLRLKESGDKERSVYHLDKAVYYNSNNEEANLALGRKPAELGNNRRFFGTDEQIKFASRMLAIEKKAVEFARKEYEVQELPAGDLPVSIQNLMDNAPDWMLQPSFEVHGAKTANFVVWLRGSQEMANEAAMWGERTVDFMEWLLGAKAAKRLNFRERATQTWKMYGFLATNRERKEFLQSNPKILNGKSVDEGMRFVNNSWRSKYGPSVMVVGTSPRYIQDSIIGNVVMYGLCFQRNDGIGQGIIHAITWYLKATSISKWGALPEGTVGEDSLALPEGTNWWMRTIRDQAVSDQDWWLAQVPRERLSRFRNDCRMKTWSMMTWMMAAYPDNWLEFFLKLPDADKKVPTLEDVEEVVTGALGKSSKEIDAEWREWARGDSGVAYGTGYGPPLLPERPSDIEIASLEQVNLVRSQLVGYTWPAGANMTEGKWMTLSECEMDAETTIGCDLHAKYLTNHPEHAESQDLTAHEENPAHADFTRQGQQAGTGNIIWGTGRMSESMARDSIDGWISAPYHRFPMLRHNIKRLGYSHYDNGKNFASVLDMSSLQEPYDPATAPRLVVWPPRDGKSMPTHFGDPELPNPLADQPEGEQDVTKCGYVVSIQLQQEISKILGDCRIELWESRKGGRPPTKNFVAQRSPEFTAWASRCKDQVECYVHTPKVPLNRKRDLRDVLFAIPKEPLRAGKYYQARAYLQLGGADMLVMVWEFGTGRQKEGLKLK